MKTLRLLVRSRQQTGACANFLSSDDFVDTSRATRQAVTSWRDMLLYGEPVGDPLPAAPVFSNIGVVTGTTGIIPEFRELRELIVASPGYTEAIGDNLMITGVSAPQTIDADPGCLLKVTTSIGYQINISGSLQGCDAMRVEYKRNGGSWAPSSLPDETPLWLVSKRSNGAFVPPL